MPEIFAQSARWILRRAESHLAHVYNDFPPTVTTIGESASAVQPVSVDIEICCLTHAARAHYPELMDSATAAFSGHHRLFS